jgi:hypothetical protein
MANASIYRPKFGTIDLMTNYWVGGHILTGWQSSSSCLNKTSLIMSEFEPIVLMKVLGKNNWGHLDSSWKFQAYVLAFHPYKVDLNPRSTAPNMTRWPKVF